MPAVSCCISACLPASLLPACLPVCLPVCPLAWQGCTRQCSLLASSSAPAHLQLTGQQPVQRDAARQLGSDACPGDPGAAPEPADGDPAKQLGIQRLLAEPGSHVSRKHCCCGGGSGSSSCPYPQCGACDGRGGRGLYRSHQQCAFPSFNRSCSSPVSASPCRDLGGNRLSGGAAGTPTLLQGSQGLHTACTLAPPTPSAPVFPVQPPQL